MSTPVRMTDTEEHVAVTPEPIVAMVDSPLPSPPEAPRRRRGVGVEALPEPRRLFPEEPVDS